MTNQEAIRILNEQRNKFLDEWVDFGGVNEAYNMSIQALEEKENAIKEIEKRKAFNLKCDGQPEWLRKGIDVGLNTAIAIIKGMEERTN